MGTDPITNLVLSSRTWMDLGLPGRGYMYLACVNMFSVANVEGSPDEVRVAGPVPLFVAPFACFAPAPLPPATAMFSAASVEGWPRAVPKRNWLTPRHGDK